MMDLTVWVVSRWSSPHNKLSWKLICPFFRHMRGAKSFYFTTETSFVSFSWLFSWLRNVSCTYFSVSNTQNFISYQSARNSPPVPWGLGETKLYRFFSFLSSFYSVNDLISDLRVPNFCHQQKRRFSPNLRTRRAAGYFRLKLLSTSISLCTPYWLWQLSCGH